MIQCLLKLKYIFIVFAVCFFAVLPLLQPGFPPTHDGEYHVIRFYEFYKTLKSGSIYPRWAQDLNNGYGIPLFNYVYPLPNYIASLFHFLGYSFIDSFKLSMFFATLTGVLFFYLWSKQFWGSIGGVVGSIFYTFSPYHFLDVYVRGSVGEVWALAFFPGLLWSFTKIVVNPRKMLYFLLSLVFLTLVIFSHNILALMFFAFFLIYAFFLILRSKEKLLLLKKSLLIVLISLSLSAIFWLPALVEKEYVTGLEIFNIQENFPEIYQLIIPSWGTGFSGENLQNQMSFQIGLANLTVVFLCAFIFIVLVRRKDKRSSVILFFVVSFFLIFFLMLKNSLFIWKSVPLMSYFQFPWRFLSLEILIASFLSGAILEIIAKKRNYLKLISAVMLVLFTFILGVGYSYPAYYHQRDDNYYISRSNFIDGTNSPGNYFNTIWMNKNLNKTELPLIFTTGKGTYKVIESGLTSKKFEIVSKTDSEITLRLAYFPGWSTHLNNELTKTNHNKDGLISINVPKGNYTISTQFIDTTIRKVSVFISLSTLILLIWLFGKSYFVRIK